MGLEACRHPLSCSNCRLPHWSLARFKSSETVTLFPENKTLFPALRPMVCSRLFYSRNPHAKSALLFQPRDGRLPRNTGNIGIHWHSLELSQYLGITG